MTAVISAGADVAEASTDCEVSAVIVLITLVASVAAGAVTDSEASETTVASVATATMDGIVEPPSVMAVSAMLVVSISCGARGARSTPACLGKCCLGRR